jgi:hypothetical protein
MESFIPRELLEILAFQLEDKYDLEMFLLVFPEIDNINFWNSYFEYNNFDNRIVKYLKLPSSTSFYFDRIKLLSEAKNDFIPNIKTKLYECHIDSVANIPELKEIFKLVAIGSPKVRLVSHVYFAIHDNCIRFYSLNKPAGKHPKDHKREVVFPYIGEIQLWKDLNSILDELWYKQFQ